MIYNTELQSQIDERIEKLRTCIDIDRRRMELQEDETRMADPQFWSDMKYAESVNKKVKENKNWIEGYDRVVSANDELLLTYEYYTAGEMTEEEVDSAYIALTDVLENLEMKNMFQKEEDKLGCVLKIVAGAGGTESCDFAGMLARMYMQYFKNHGYRPDTDFVVADKQDDETSGGFKTISFQVNASEAYGYLKAETGVHRLVRVSPFNAQGKRMTSFVSVFVTPLVDDSFEIELDESKLSFDYFRCGGAGGQNVNKVESGVRARYWYTDPDTGEREEILVENTETRDQPVNKANALRILKSILYDKELKRRQKERDRIEDSKKKIEWGAQIRSYVMDDRRVKDHRTNYQTSDVNGVFNGNIDGFIKAYLMEFND